MFINLSNHPSKNWSKKQIEESKIIGGEIIDISFPNVDGEWGEEKVLSLMKEYVDKILELTAGEKDTVIMVQGEFTLSYAIVNRFLTLGYKVVSACSNRIVTEQINQENGKVVKEVIFEFIRYREYRK